MKTQRFFFRALCVGVLSLTPPLFATSYHRFGIHQEDGKEGVFHTYNDQRYPQEFIEKILDRIALVNAEQTLIVMPSKNVKASDLIRFLGIVRANGLENIIMISGEVHIQPTYVRVQPGLPEGIKVDILDLNDGDWEIREPKE